MAVSLAWTWPGGRLLGLVGLMAWWPDGLVGLMAWWPSPWPGWPDGLVGLMAWLPSLRRGGLIWPGCRLCGMVAVSLAWKI